MHVHDELPGELFKEGSYFFEAGAKRGELIERGSSSRGEIIWTIS